VNNCALTEYCAFPRCWREAQEEDLSRRGQAKAVEGRPAAAHGDRHLREEEECDLRRGRHGERGSAGWDPRVFCSQAMDEAGIG
jgi:hypothetical protein